MAAGREPGEAIGNAHGAAAVQRLASPAQPARARAVTESTVARGSTMALAQRSAGDPAPMALARPAAQATLSQASIPGPSVQTAPIAAPASPPPVFGPTATAVVQRVDGSAPAAPPPASVERSDGELDELAKQLFGRFRSRLRNEYIYEREAKGLTFDNS